MRVGNSFSLRFNLDYDECNRAAAQKMDDTSRCFAFCGCQFDPKAGFVIFVICGSLAT